MMYSSVRSINARPKPVSKRILEDQLVFMHVRLLVRIVEIEGEIRDVSGWMLSSAGVRRWNDR
jgi:hypothetical protein